MVATPSSGDELGIVPKIRDATERIPSIKLRAKILNRATSKESNRHMKIKLPLSLLAAASLAFSSAAFAAGAKTYQVTGPVLEVTDSMIAVQKGKDRWEVNRDANTKVTGDVKVGEKVTVTYTMSATDVEVKAGKGAKKEAASPALREAYPAISVVAVLVPSTEPRD